MRHLILAYLLITLLSCGNSPATPAEVQAPPPGSGESIAAADFDLSPIPGTDFQLAVRRNDEGKIMEQGRVDQSLVKQGDWTVFHADSDMPAKTVSYVNGHFNGIALDIDVHGRVTTMYNYLMNELHGPYLQYKITHPELVSNYHHGQLNGWYREYDYRNGKLKKEVLYSNGQMNGPFRQFNDDEELMIEYTYRNGELVE